MTALLMLFALYAFVLGACFGSFAAVVGERGRAGLSIGGRSRCACGRMLRPWENVPVLGWVRVRGRARCCGAVIPSWYVHLEWTCGVWFVLVGAAGAAAWSMSLPPVVVVLGCVAGAGTGVVAAARVARRCAT